MFVAADQAVSISWKSEIYHILLADVKMITWWYPLQDIAVC